MNLFNKKIEEQFIKEIMQNGIYADKEELVFVLEEIKPILNKNKDKSPDEIVELLLNIVNSKMKELINNYPIPGYNILINSGNISANLYGGVLDDTDKKMNKEAIFDVASISKLFTQIISYNLIKEGYYNFDSIVSSLDPKFKNATNLDIRTIMNFSFSYTVDGKIEDASSVEEAKNILYSLGVNEKNIYKYIDFGMLCLKEVMEHVTKKSYEELIKIYITDKLELQNTYLNVPEEKIELVTGTPNAALGRNNDMKSIKLGGYSGNAGILSDSIGLISVVKNLYINDDFFPLQHLSDVYTQSKYSKISGDKRGLMGNACCIPGGPFVDTISPLNSSAYQGSTRTQVNVGTFNNILTTSTILLNPASMGLQKARQIEEELNKKFVTEYNFEGKDYKQFATQIILPVNEVVKPLTKEIAKLSLRLAFINSVINAYEPKYNEKIDIEINNEKNKSL